MYYEVAHGCCEARNDSTRIVFSIKLEDEPKNFLFKRTVKLKKSKAEKKLPAMRELLNYVASITKNKDDFMECVEWLESIASKKEDGVSWKCYAEEAKKQEELEKNKISVSEYALNWHQLRKETYDLRTSTITHELTIINRICEYFGDYTIQSLTANDINRVQAKMKSEGVTDDARLRVHKKLKAIMNDAVEEGFIAKSPFTKKVITPKVAQKRDRKILNSEEVICINTLARNNALKEPEYLAIYIGIQTGARIGEILALDWNSIDEANALITINKQLGKGSNLAPTKTQTSVRKIPISNELLEILKEWKNLQREYFQTLRTTQTEHSPIISNEVCRFYNPDTYRRWFKRFCCENGFGAYYGTNSEGIEVKLKYNVYDPVTHKRLYGNGYDADDKPFSRNNPKKGKTHYKGLHFHDLRHSFATLCLAEGAPLANVSSILGHAELDTTLKMYVDALPERNRGVIDTLNSLIEEKQND